MMRFYPLEKLINLHDGYCRSFRIDHLELLLLSTAGDVYLVESRCPHREHPLQNGRIEGGVIECALHHYKFSLQSGTVLNATEETCRALKTFEPIFEGTEVGVMLPD